ncbi:unnamed protein product [Adineta steineri]|uniref:Uncharacterized protein n=1 Tax=Adineta steineri TaxID=433720 RepID=A0A814GHV5_9BILA|nr:unnamed protein product [Adineta steineri]CAF3605990.1 unnamed protein product [Adineta steineri]CAF3796363.1 unnamed protein product [Adineta steineri]
MKDAGNSAFVCPNDRQLQLRAKLSSGWSFHSSRPLVNRVNSPITPPNNQSLRDEEIERIKKVLERAQRIELLEQERVGKLIDRLENMKKHATGNGSSQCVLCADGFGMLGASAVICVDCHKSVCNKCSIETVYNQQVITLCKICSENRELWKKSGAWFFRSLPSRSSLPASVKPSASCISATPLKNDILTSEDDSSSDEQQNNTGRLNQRPSPVAAIPHDHFTTVNPFQQVSENPSPISEHDRDESIDSFKTDTRSSKELSIEDYLPTVQSPIPSMASSSINLRPSPSIVVNTSSPIDDCGFGTLDFEIIWKESLNVLTITLLRARSLRSCDSNGLSDPYVKLHLVPGVAKATKLRSHTIRRTLNPDFDETLVYHGISLEDMKTKSLKFSVYDEDSVGSDFLGEYRLRLSTIRADVKEAYAVYLQNKTEDIELPTDEDKNERGKILLSLMYSKPTNNFHVKVIRGSQLLPMDFGQTSDPYCKLVLFPSTDMGVKWNFKTSVKKHTLQPEYNEEFIFQHIQLQELISRTLQVTVFDKDMGKKDDYIGGFQLGQSASGDDLKHWLMMVKSPGQWVEMWHKLKPEQFYANSNHRDSQISR